jgi:hypothetical protein
MRLAERLPSQELGFRCVGARVWSKSFGRWGDIPAEHGGTKARETS